MDTIPKLQPYMPETENLPFPGVADARTASGLLRMNIAPLLACRDAAFDIASAQVNDENFAQRSGDERRAAYLSIAAQLKNACESTSRMAMLFNSPDTRARETRLLKHFLMLWKLGSSLKNISDLPELTFEDAESDITEGISGIDNREACRISNVMCGVEAELFAQLISSLRRSQQRVNRYREYILKNFSEENARRYNASYRGYMEYHSAALTGVI